MNLSSTPIPNDVQSFLQLERTLRYQIGIKNIIFDCIKSIEYSTRKLSIDKRIDITNHSIPIFNNLVSFPLFTIPIDTKLLKLEIVTKDFFKLNPDIIFTHADKNNVIVVLEKDFYINKVNEMLGDMDT